MNINLQIAEELNLNPVYVDNVVQLIDEGNTIPFIARYRKELHGSMDDTTLRTLNERLEYLRNLDDRRQTIINAITEQGKLTEELAAAIEEAKTLAALEDLAAGNTAGDVDYAWHGHVSKAHPYQPNDRRIVYK